MYHTYQINPKYKVYNSFNFGFNVKEVLFTQNIAALVWFDICTSSVSIIMSSKMNERQRSAQTCFQWCLLFLQDKATTRMSPYRHMF